MVKKLFGKSTGADKLDVDGGINPASSFVMGLPTTMFMSGADVKATASGPAANKLKR